MRRSHLWMYCQRIEINLGALAGLSLMAIVVLWSRRKGEVPAVCALLRVMSNEELGPREILVKSLDPGIIETEGLRASGLDRGAFRAQQDKEPARQIVAVGCSLVEGFETGSS